MNRAPHAVTVSRFPSTLACALAFGLSLALLSTPVVAVDKLFSANVNSIDPEHVFYQLTLQSGQGSYVPVANAGDAVSTSNQPWDDVLEDNYSSGYPVVLYASLGLDDEMHSQADPGYTLSDLIDAIYTAGHQPDYFLLDLETNQNYDLEANMLRIQDLIDYVRDVKGDDQVKFGNYYFYPGASDTAYHLNPQPSSNWLEKREASDQFYNGNYYSETREETLEGGLTVAMPRLYPDSNLIHHHDEGTVNNIPGWGEEPEGISPTQRSALFWSPLEQFSHAKRNLPQDHELIPFVSDYDQSGSWVPDQGQGPTREDNAASITHYRLRGADGIQAYGFYDEDDPGYEGEQTEEESIISYRLVVAAGWKAVDPLFSNPGVTRYLNAATNPDDADERTEHFATNKNGGVEWSAAQKGNRVMAIVSNLSGSTMSADDLIGWADRPQLPAQLPQDVADGEHALMQYRTYYLDDNNMEQYADDEPMDNQGSDSWQGPAPDKFTAQAPSGSGNPSDTAVVSNASGANDAWYAGPEGNPGYADTDIVVYSAWLYVGATSISFGPANTDGASSSGIPDGNHQGPKFYIDDEFNFRKTFTSVGPTYTAVNLAADDQTWYEVQVVADPTDGSDGMGKVYVRDVTNGQRDFTLLTFDDTSTTGTTERYWKVPLILAGDRDTTDFDGWIIRSTGGAGNAVDNLNTGYYVPRMNDNFEHYDDSTGVTMDEQTVPWNGPVSSGPTKWRVGTPSGAGNDSNLAAELIDSAGTASAWWKTENPQFTATDLAVYSAKIFSGGGLDEIEVFFQAVNTDDVDTDELVPNSQSGFSAGFFLTEGFSLIVPGGATYTSDFIPDDDIWYDIQIQIDQTANDGDGAARVWIKDLTNNDTPFLVEFDEETLLPLAFSSANNPTVWDGWQLSGYGDTLQLDSFRSFLFPYTDFDAYNLYIDDPDFSVSLSDRAQLSAPEPTSLALLSAGSILLFRRRCD